MESYWENFGNTSGLSAFSQKADHIIEDCRERVSSIFNVKSSQIVFTSSATEANGIAIWSVYRFIHSKNKERVKIAFSPLEHPSVTETIKRLPQADLHSLKLTPNGEIDIIHLKYLLDEKKVNFLVILLVHNETGLIQPIQNVLKILQGYKEVFLLCDSVQALSKLRKGQNTESLNFDLFAYSKETSVLFSFAGHKIGAGFGTGLLIIPDGLDHIFEVVPFAGGNQESGIRPGSHNLSSIVAFANVLEKISIGSNDYDQLKKFTLHFEQKLLESITKYSSAKIICGEQKRLAGTTMVILYDIPIDFFLIGLDQKNIIISTGTSCRSRSRTPSEGLLSLGLTRKEALSVVRFSYSHNFVLQKQKMVLDTIEELAGKITTRDTSISQSLIKLVN